jgi:ATP-dependent Lhr-like helicase
LRKLESGEVAIVARDLTAPSPFAAEALNAPPYAFLDDAPLEERRTQAVMSRRYADADSADDLGRLDPAAIESCASRLATGRNCRRDARGVDGTGLRHGREAQAMDGTDCWRRWPGTIALRAFLLLHVNRQRLWFAAERLPQAHVLFPEARREPSIEAPAEFAAQAWSREDAALELVRSRMGGLGPVTPMHWLHRSRWRAAISTWRFSDWKARVMSCVDASRRPHTRRAMRRRNGANATC